MSVKQSTCRIKHGHAFPGQHSPEYRTWNCMTQRCHNPKNTNFHRYGARGIKVCQRWRESFQAFLADMGTKSSPRHTIDRHPDNNGDYEPGNCRWATMAEQHKNTRRSRLVTFRSETLCVSDWAKRLGIHRGTLKLRLARWSVEKALTTPKGG